MTVTLVTVEGVPIVSTGTYQLASGETTFTAEHLAAAVEASQDPTVPAPRLKLGHTDPRFDEAVASAELDGEPAFGTAQNLRLSADGQTILADYVNVPDWLAETMASSYPGRSIEGGWDWTAPSGRSYELVIARVALLGVTWPGVTSLEDLQEVMTQNGQADEPSAAIEAESRSFVMARIARPGDGQTPPTERRSTPDPLAGMDLGNVRMRFCADLDDGQIPTPEGVDLGSQYWWWIRSIRVEDDGSLCVIVDDDEGHLLQIPFTVEDNAIVWGDPTIVIETYVPAPASQPVTARGGRALASWPVRAARPSTQTEVTTVRLNGREVDAAALRTRLGLADDAEDAAIYEALGIEPEEPEAEPAETAPTATPAAEPVAAASGADDGMVRVDRETWEATRQGAQAGAQVAAELAEQRRDRVISAAITDGKFPPARRAHYETLWARDPEGTATLLTATVEAGGLAPGLVPVGRREIGGGGDGDSQPGIADAEHEQFMARFFPTEAARLRAASGETNGARVRVRTEA